MEDLTLTHDSENEAKLVELTKKIEALQKEKLALGNENKEIKEKIKTVTLEVNELRNKEEEMKQELNRLEDDSAVLESLSSRSADLENEVSRLQHHLITSVGEIDDANREAVELKKGLEEKETVIESMEKEMDGLKKAKVEVEKKERDLERKLVFSEVKEIKERSKHIQIEEELKEKMDQLQKKIEVLEAEATKTRLELEKASAEKLEFEERATSLEFNMLELKEEVEKKMSESMKGRSRDKGFGGWLFRVPVAVLLAAAVAYQFRRKRRVEDQ
ncbi:hypothetical protein V6N13_111095 [Hibiscus sabdariffa]|uniref:Uncharacterized protein n=1 Tax=Hibiscus sabdariffa TaxID=183260 RepID=A0ABR2TJI0_9ROSI